MSKLKSISLVGLLVGASLIVGCNTIRNLGTNKNTKPEQNDLYGEWKWFATPPSKNNTTFVISSTQVVYIADQPNVETNNGAFTIDILKWTVIQNTGDNQATFPSGFRVDGVIKNKNGNVLIGQNVGDSIRRDFYLNSRKDKLVRSTSNEATVLEKQKYTNKRKRKST